MRRVVIVGNSGSGKTTLADAVATRLAVPHVELDAHFHQRGWVPTPEPEFLGAVRSALDAADADADGWVVCGNYAAVRSSIWARADSIVWLDLPRAVVMTRVIWRSVRRVVGRAELWNGNRESLLELLALHDPDRSLIRWSWDGVERYRSLYVPAMASPAWGDVRWYRLRSAAAVEQWLAQVSPRDRDGHTPAGGMTSGISGSRSATAGAPVAPRPAGRRGGSQPGRHPIGSTSLPRVPTNTPGEGDASWREGSLATRWWAGA